MTIQDPFGDPPKPQVDMQLVEVFHFEDGKPTFEDFGTSNGFRSWSAFELSLFLGYESFSTFRKAVSRAMTACVNLGIPLEENFKAVKRDVDGKQIEDFKLSRFACYLTALNGDPKKPKVAQAQTYFVAIAESFQQYLEDAEGLERLYIRDEISEHEKSLSSTAKRAGVAMYAYMQNAGYRGMYNMNLGQLKIHKGKGNIKKPLLDYMGKRELAANQFRLIETEARISGQAVRGQKACENAAFTVGKDVRIMMQKSDGTKPEDLPLEADISESRKKLKQASKEFGKIDSKPKLPK